MSDRKRQTEWPSLKSLQTINAAEGVEKREPFYTVGGNVNWYNHCGNSMEVSQKTNPAIPPLVIYLKKMKTLIWKDTCIPIFIAALFIIAKIWKQLIIYNSKDMISLICGI